MAAGQDDADWHHAIVRILTNEKELVGAGFLVTDDRVMTCAHVVGDAFGDHTRYDAPEGELWVDFPIGAPGKWLRASVDQNVWAPYWGDEETPSLPGDTTVLQLKPADLHRKPRRSRPVPVAKSYPGSRPDFGAFGVPAKAGDGTWCYGKVGGRVAGGVGELLPDVVPENQVEQGFSGTAVWDPDRGVVFGMICERQGEWRGRFIPGEALHETFSELTLPFELDGELMRRPRISLTPYLRYFDRSKQLAQLRPLLLNLHAKPENSPLVAALASRSEDCLERLFQRLDEDVLGLGLGPASDRLSGQTLVYPLIWDAKATSVERRLRGIREDLWKPFADAAILIEDPTAEQVADAANSGFGPRAFRLDVPWTGLDDQGLGVLQGFLGFCSDVHDAGLTKPIVVFVHIEHDGSAAFTPAFDDLHEKLRGKFKRLLLRRLTPLDDCRWEDVEGWLDDPVGRELPDVRATIESQLRKLLRERPTFNFRQFEGAVDQLRL